MPVVLDLRRAIDPGDHLELRGRPIRPRRPHAQQLSRFQPIGDAQHVEDLVAGQPQALGALARQELERQDTHPHQVAPVDPLVALGDGGPDAQQHRALGSPVARAAAAVLLAGDDQERHALRLVARRGLIDRHQLAAREMGRPAALAPTRQAVAQADVGERAAYHHLVVAPPRAVAVEVLRLHPTSDQVLAGRAVDRDRASRGDVVSRHRVAQHRQHAGSADIGQRRWLQRQILEERWLLNVGRIRIPGIEVAFGYRQRAPVLVPGEDIAVPLDEQLRPDRLFHRLADLLRRGPDLPEVDRLAIRVVADRLGREIDVHPTSDGIGHHQRRRGEIAGPHLRVDPSLEVAISAQHRDDDELVILHRLGDRRRQRPAIADARRATVTDQVEAQRLQVRQQPSPFEVRGHHA